MIMGEARPFVEVFRRRDIAGGYNTFLLGKNTSRDTFAFRQYADRFVNLLGLRGAKKDWVDVGCGPGHLTIAMAQEMQGGKVYFMDLSPTMIDLAKQNLREGSWNSKVRHETLAADAQNIDQVFGGIKLDGIVSRHVVQFMKEPHKFFQGAYSFLKPNAKLVFSLIGYSSFNFYDSRLGNSIFQNKFLSRLLWSTLQALPFLLSKLSPSQINDLLYEGVLVKTPDGITISQKAILPKMDKVSMYSEFRKAGIPASAISYLIMGEIRTVGFKQAFSEKLGSIPIPGVWNVLERLDHLTRVLAVKRIYERAFPGDKNMPICLEDPIFIITKGQEDSSAALDNTQKSEVNYSGLVGCESTKILPGFSQIRIARESFERSAEQIAELALKYGYDAWRVRGFDIQRASAHLINPPQSYKTMDFATLILQSNNFTFTCSEKPFLSDQEARIATPYRVVLQNSENEKLPQRADLFFENRPIEDFDSFRLIEIMFAPSIWYFAFKDSQGLPLPKYLIINPYEDCAFRCKPCSRTPFYSNPHSGYMSNVDKIIKQVSASAGNLDEIKFVNIITGSQETPEKDFQMFQDIINRFRAANFNKAEFGVYSQHISDIEMMKRLHEMGVMTFTVTMEITSDDIRPKLYGRGGKGAKKFADFLDMVKRAESVFPYVSISLILGHEPSDPMKRNLTQLANETRGFINHFIPRIFMSRQYDILHPEAIEGGLAYYVDLFRFIEDINYGRATFGKFFEERFGIEKFKARFRS